MSNQCCSTGKEERANAHAHAQSWQWPGAASIARLAVAALALLLLWWHGGGGTLWKMGGLAVAVGCGYPIIKAALLSLYRRRMTMQLSMTIALAAALAIGETLTALVIVFFVLIAEELESLTARRGRRSISSLLDLLPHKAFVKRDGQFVEADVQAIQPGDVVLVKPGTRIVVDGQVIAGTSFVDESTITGESLPAEKQPGSLVFAGTINQSGALTVSTGKVGADTAFGKIVHAVEHAEDSQAPVQRLADRMAGFLILFVLTGAALTYLVTTDVRTTISVIIVAGACGIAAGTPLAILGSIGLAAKRGSVVKGGLYIERLASLDVAVFDKTGTLTSGHPHVVAVQAFGDSTRSGVLQAAAAAESKSEHPLARAIMARAAELDLPIDEPGEFAYVPGRGIEAVTAGGVIVVGNRLLMEERGVGGLPAVRSNRPPAMSEMFVACNGKLSGRIFIADTVRPEARQAVFALRALGIRTIMLTGDGDAVAKSVARQLTIDEYAAELRPEDKRIRVEQLQRQGHTVAMVGDGVNDAPALRQAAVAVAVGSGTDVAVESANVVLIGNDLLRFVEAVQIARRCRRVIWFNFAGTVAVDAVGMLLAFMGVLNPLLAAFVHVGSELAFFLNSARLFPVLSRRREDHK